jgi:high-affinity K+ transport system ATPase subunit B
MSKLARDRGAQFEREVCARIEEVIGIQTKRKLGQARDSGNDIDLKRENGTHFRLECKRRRAIGNLYEWLQQAQDSCSTPGDTPVVVCRGDGEKRLAVMYLDDLLPLIAGDL